MFFELSSSFMSICIRIEQQRWEIVPLGVKRKNPNQLVAYVALDQEVSQMRNFSEVLSCRMMARKKLHAIM